MNHASYKNVVSSSMSLENDPSMQSFTATGRPYRKPSNQGDALNSISGAESYGAAPANFLPVKFTDDSIISVPVLPYASIRSASNGQLADTESTTNSTTGLIKHKDDKKTPFWKRKPSSSGSKRSVNNSFVMKQMTRRDYLAHYAKDDDGKYIGTKEPAEDCILKLESDLTRWRSTSKFENEIRQEG